MQPTVSVIIPNYNHAPYLRQRIDSVLGQTFGDFEVILLDDCSSDNSREIIEEYRNHPKVSHVELNAVNSGSTFAQWKLGIGLAKGKYVWIAESDDYADPQFLATLVPLLDADPQAAMAFSGSHMVDSSGNEIPGMDWDRYKSGAPVIQHYTGIELTAKKLLWTADVYNASMVVFRHAMAPAISDLQLGMRYCGDWLFWTEMAHNGGAVEVRRKLNYFRQHTAKVSPGASKSGLYFIEGLPIMIRIASYLNLNSLQRAMIAGRTWKRLGKFRDILKSRESEIMNQLDALSPGASSRRLRLITLYEVDKYLNLTRLQP